MSNTLEPATRTRPAAWSRTDSLVMVIIPNWNRPHDTAACLTSLSRSTYSSAEAMVVDNGSTDDSVEHIAHAFPGVRLLVSHRNLGFAGACNLALRWALAQRVDYVLLLNNDATVEPEAIGRLVTTAREEDAAIVGPKIYFRKVPQVLWSAGGYVDWKLGHANNRGTRQVDVGQYQAREEMEWVNGCAMLASTRFISKVGLLDTGFFMFYEEVDWCFRARKAGFKVVYEPEASVWHDVSTSSTEDKRREWYFASRSRFLRKHAPKRTYLRLLSRELIERLLE